MTSTKCSIIPTCKSGNIFLTMSRLVWWLDRWASITQLELHWDSAQREWLLGSVKYFLKPFVFTLYIPSILYITCPFISSFHHPSLLFSWPLYCPIKSPSTSDIQTGPFIHYQSIHPLVRSIICSNTTHGNPKLFPAWISLVIVNKLSMPSEFNIINFI